MRNKFKSAVVILSCLVLFQGCAGKFAVHEVDSSIITTSEIDHGKFLSYDSVFSKKLNYPVYYRVYIPFGYEELSGLPSIYVTDGQDYSYQGSGNMISVLDALIYQKKIEPVIAVFVDPRTNPDNGKNMREKQFMMNSDYADFYRDELIPLIDSTYKTGTSPDKRAIVGVSLGGINSAYFGVYLEDVFHLIGINSPAFMYKSEIYELYKKSGKLPLKIMMTAGTRNDDTHSGALRMKHILEKKGYTFKYIEVPEDHSWENWRPLLDDLLMYFFANAER